MASTDPSLMDLAAQKWADLAGAYPDLEPAVELQRKLLGEVIAVLDRLDRSGAVTRPLPPAAIVEKLQRGVPVLRGEAIEIPVHELAPTLDIFCQHLANGGAGDVARHVMESFQSGRINRSSLLRSSLARDQKAIHQGATQMGLSPDLVWLVGELSTSPLAFLLQRAMFGEAEASDRQGQDGIVRAALVSWDRGYCPACGSWPALAEYVSGLRSLRCSFCAAAWEMLSYRCVYCGDEGTGFVTSAPDPERPQRLLELCGQCGGYTKAIQVEAAAPFPLVAIEDLETLDLDRSAIDHGYTRPSLPELSEDATFAPPRPAKSD
jgi:FdhE protein